MKNVFKWFMSRLRTLAQILRGQESLSLAQSLGRFRWLLARAAVDPWREGRGRIALACRAHKKRTERGKEITVGLGK